MRKCSKVLTGTCPLTPAIPGHIAYCAPGSFVVLALLDLNLEVASRPGEPEGGYPSDGTTLPLERVPCKMLMG